MSWRLVPATEQHVEALAPWVRGDDAEELRASGFASSLGALKLGLEVSRECWAALLDGEVACIWGVSPFPGQPKFHAVWMLTSHLVETRPREFLRLCKVEVARLLETYPALCNAVDARYTRALRWAEWLGFTVGQAIPYGPEDRPFHPIGIEREAPCAHP